MEAYAIKAAREGKVETSWINPDEAHEASLKRFLRRMLDRGESAEFLASFDAFARRTALLGALNSLSQLTLKATMPGIPDFYQGTELWDFSLVDPDNRRPVDFAARAEALAQPDADWPALAAAWPDGRIKAALTHRLLALRNEHAALFAEGAYRPVDVRGRDRDHVLAFARVGGRDAVVVAVGRRFAPLSEGGRRWPAGWEAELSLEGFSAVRNLLVPGPPAGEPAIARLFDPVPVTVLRASLTGAVPGRRSAPTEPALA
jgi:(1->4)-alpha-D-glucan 1-alpha-D-glucosylmutase